MALRDRQRDELVGEIGEETFDSPPYRVETRMGAVPDGPWGNVGTAYTLEQATAGADWFADDHAGGRVIDQATGKVVDLAPPPSQ